MQATAAPTTVPALRILTATFAYNEGEKIRQTVAKHARARSYDLLLMDDGSTDGAVDDVRRDDLIRLRNPMNRGIGAAMKQVFEFALRENYDVIVIQAGNDKDDPREIPRLLEPILAGRADFVQGSRFLAGGQYRNMPRYRVLATRLHPCLFSLLVGKRVTESTNGFRAFRTVLLRDARVLWRQDWLDRYELEPYLLYKAVTLGYRHLEVPVTKTYPARELGYTKMRPITDWWSILRPIVYLRLGLKR